MCVMRKTADAPAPRVSRQPFYEALVEVNLDFDHIRDHIERLRQLAIFRGRSGRAFLPAFDAAVSEARAWFNTELLEAQGEVESREWARLDLLRAHREKAYRDDDSPSPKPRPGASTKRTRAPRQRP